MSEEIGRVVEVHGSQVKIELARELRSPVRASLDGVDTKIRINGFVTFDLGGGDVVFGILTDLFAREIYEPGNEELTLELSRPRRVATTQLLGTVRTTAKGGVEFDPGVNVLPTLDTPALPADPSLLVSILETAPSRNQPATWAPKNPPFDGPITLGFATAAPERQAKASFNDFFSRPLAVLGNTGSGKSCTIAHLIQEAQATHPTTRRPHFFVLDINGEYSEALGTGLPVKGRQPNRIYFNGIEGSVPMWLMNAFEVCHWLSAAEQTQQPALVNLWALAKGASSASKQEDVGVQGAMRSLTQIRQTIENPDGFYKGQDCKAIWEAVSAYAPWLAKDTATSNAFTLVEKTMAAVTGKYVYSKSFGGDEPKLLQALGVLEEHLEASLDQAGVGIEQTADKPIRFAASKLDNPTNLTKAAELSPGDRSVHQFLQGLQLRIQNRRNDRRWHCFYNYDSLGIGHVQAWLRSLGVDCEDYGRVTVIDCSMIGHEVLPYVCGIIGRMLLELREQVDANSRFHDPWVLVLEEAHNYVKPRREDDTKGLVVSRETFERIAKEGRKFGLSLIVASQRPSDVSPTVLSQCANFVVHRLQNPDDIDHFRRTVPSQSRRLIDQITILRPGEAVVVGSGVNIPNRVQVRRPSPEPKSQSAAPYSSWSADAEVFATAAAIGVWDIPPESTPPGTAASSLDDKTGEDSSSSPAEPPGSPNDHGPPF